MLAGKKILLAVCGSIAAYKIAFFVRLLKKEGAEVQVIMTESFISFLGLGVQEPLTSWGVLISEGAKLMEAAPWRLVFPAAAPRDS